MNIKQQDDAKARTTITVGAQFDKATHAQIQAIARAEERSLANLVRLAVKQYVGNRIRVL